MLLHINLKILLKQVGKFGRISADRLESVAEHIYGTQMLAFSVKSELNLGLVIEKVIFMLAFHELGECKVGDLTIYDNITKQEKHNLELKAVEECLNTLSNKNCGGDIFNL